MRLTIRTTRSRAIWALLATALSGAACIHPIEPVADVIVDVTGEYDAVRLDGMKPPVTYDSSSSGWNAIIAEHLVLRADRTWWVDRTDRYTRKGVSTESTFEATRGTWNNSAGGPALLTTPTATSAARAALSGDTLVLTEPCRSIQECIWVGDRNAVFVRSPL